MEQVIIDVRERDEFLSEHIEGSINIPLTDFPTHAPGVLRQVADRPLLFMCRGGNRARLAVDSLKTIPVTLQHPPQVFDGGILAWQNKGLPVVKLRAARLPIIRQVHLCAGLLVLVGAVLALTINLWWAVLPAFVGAGLTLAGATGFCGMAMLLAKAPWNR